MKSPLRWLLPLLPVPVLALLAFGLTRDARVLPSAMTGTEAPALELPTTTGDTLALADLRGKVVVLNFWASWCIPCRAEHGILERATEEYSPDEVAVIGVLYQDSEENAERFVDTYGGGWPTLLDDGSRAAIDYGVYGVPETFYIGRDGRIARKRIGPVTWPALVATVDSLLAEPRGGGNLPSDS